MDKDLKENTGATVVQDTANQANNSVSTGTPQVDSTNQTNTQKGKRAANKKPKRRIKKRWCALGLALVLGATGFWAQRTGKLDSLYEKYFNKDTKPQDEITLIADSLPLDDNGIVSITFPVVDRNLSDPAGLYSLPTGYSPYYVEVEGNESSLSKVTDSTKNGVNVDNYQSSNGAVPSGYVGVLDKYAAFLAQVEAIKANIKNGDNKYTSPLTKIEYDVPDLYYLASGYDLYCEDQTTMSSAKLAYVLPDGSKIYSIPSNVVDKFIGVTNETCEIIVKYDELRGQISEIYNVYTAQGITNNEEQTNPSR